jgi:hypothetical protein
VLVSDISAGTLHIMALAYEEHPKNKSLIHLAVSYDYSSETRSSPRRIYRRSRKIIQPNSPNTEDHSRSGASLCDSALLVYHEFDIWHFRSPRAKSMRSKRRSFRISPNIEEPMSTIINNSNKSLINLTVRYSVTRRPASPKRIFTRSRKNIQSNSPDTEDHSSSGGASLCESAYRTLWEEAFRVLRRAQKSRRTYV